MPDLPAGLTLPMENVFVLGVREQDVIEWKQSSTCAWRTAAGAVVAVEDGP